ncbi:MAG: hypothetical protein Q4A52_06960, partial [Bacillota bacterium]|nr:hypothetical protein [Bacillota bacterium]
PLFSDVDIAGVDLIDEKVTRHKPPFRINYWFIGINVVVFLFLWRLINTIAMLKFGYRRKKMRKRKRA